MTSDHGFAGDVPDYSRTRADARRRRAESASLSDGEEGGGSVFPEFDNVTVEIEGFALAVVQLGIETVSCFGNSSDLDAAPG